MIKLNDAQANKARSLLLDLCIRNRLVPNTRAEGYGRSRYGVPFISGRFERVSASIATTILNALTNRTFNFKEVDEALANLKTYTFSFGDNPKSDYCGWTVKHVEGTAKFLAWICAENKIYWNDSAYTPAEREAWRSESVFARYLFDAECFVSQPSKKVRTRTAVDPTREPGTEMPAAEKTAPKSGYKSAGPQSAYVAGLVSKPGEKETISERLIFCIQGDKAGTIVPKAFIHPVENPDIGEKAKVNAAGLPIVKFGAGNGYTDLTIFSTSPKVMEDILAKLAAGGKALSKYTNVKVVKTHNDGGRFFRVNTEYGEVLVKPTKLNEKLFIEALEDLSENTVTELSEAIDYSSVPNISNIDNFTRDSKLYD